MNFPSQRVSSWGGVSHSEHQVWRMHWRGQEIPSAPERGWLPYAYGRSYGDSCLNPSGGLLLTTGLDRFISLDLEQGVLRCEAGVSLDQILKLIVPRGWFLPVVPGTRFISIGGAIANDVHGKNHHIAGTFGTHVLRFALLRSDGTQLVCSPGANTELYRATIGGLGLTGMILWAELSLRRISSAEVFVENIPVRSLEQFYEVSEDSDEQWDYTVSWLDCTAGAGHYGRGVFMRGYHAEDGELSPHLDPKLSIPMTLPGFLLNRNSIYAFNRFYEFTQSRKRQLHRQHYAPFFFPLDMIDNWNRIYGRAGFFQYQFVLPWETARQVLPKILKTIKESGEGSFLAVLKCFGDKKSPGTLSFPFPGVTLALDFRNRGESTVRLFQQLDGFVSEGGGRLYPAKDACMSASMFQRGYPQWQELEAMRDPAFQSGFWRRVTQ